MPRTEASNRAQYKYNAAKLKRIPLDVQQSEYETIKASASAAGQPVNTYIKQAIRERQAREAVSVSSQDAQTTE